MINDSTMEVSLAQLADSHLPCEKGELANFLPASFFWVSPPLYLRNEDGEENRKSQ